MKYIVKKEDESLTIKEIMKNKMGISSRLYTKLKKSKKITVNNKNRMPHEFLREADVLEVNFDYEENTFEIEEGNLEIIYEDDMILAINKEPFLVVHPTKGHPTGTLMNHIAYYLSEKGDISKIRFVNRLDRDTSGVIIVAKNQFIHHQLSEEMKIDRVNKEYVALVQGVVEKNTDIIDLPIERESEDSINRVVREDGKPSKTQYKVIERINGFTLLDIKLFTGRTHQIRVHLEHIGHPIVGDELYYKKSDLIERQFLHCTSMDFFHPVTGEKIYLKAPFKKDMENALKILRGD
ncbi:MAG: RluA family pseudouridine synthase [Clostridiales bacterium]|nr:RluA family pseudouridine synthase [Clostridiales bacterium]